MKRFALSVDIGGTFTDFVLLDRQKREIATAKVLSTPDRSELAILDGVRKLEDEAELDLVTTDLFLHATTIITNAVIERRGSKFIFLHTEGFRDILEIGREHRYNLTDLKLRFPESLSDRRLRLPIAERTSASGAIALAPKKGDVQEAVARLADRTKVRNFAVCFLHSYRNAANEKLVEDWIRELYPDAYISCSANVAPSQREYERWTTCSINAYTMPLLTEYIGRLNTALEAAGFPGRGLMMTSSGLPMEFMRCVDYPIRMIESGPAAGVLAAKEIAGRNELGDSVRDSSNGLSNILAFDMGGTTAKGAFLTSGEVHVQRSLEVARIGTFQAGSGLPLIIPAIDLIEIGAGGGSIASVDGRGVIAVGPRSAGAVPGPACYGRGGDQPTLTDANVVLGYLSPDSFKNSGIVVSPQLAADAIERTLAVPLRTSVQRAARAVRETINENVARAFRVHAGELGLDYRNYALVCTGGSAPLHAAEIARILHIKRVIFPFGAGVSSAFGLFAGREGLTLQRTNVVELRALEAGRVGAEVAAMIASDTYAAALSAAGADTTLSLGLRYVGQGYEVSVKIGSPSNSSANSIREAFEQEYLRIFGTTFPDYVIEIFNWTLQISAPRRLVDPSGYRYSRIEARGQSKKGERSITEVGGSADVSVPVYDRYALKPRDIIEGGAVVEESDATILLPTFARAVVQDSYDILAEIKPAR